MGVSGTLPPNTGGDLGVVTLSPVSWPPSSPHSLCSPLGEVGVGPGPEGSSAGHCSPYIKGGAGQGVRPAQGRGWDLSTNQEAFPQPSPSGPVLPVASAQQPWLALNLLGIRGQAPSGGPAGGGATPTKVPGRELASREKSLQGS